MAPTCLLPLALQAVPGVKWYFYLVGTDIQRQRLDMGLFPYGTGRAIITPSPTKVMSLSLMKYPNQGGGLISQSIMTGTS